MLSEAEIKRRNNIQTLGSGDHTLLLAHGFGCDQNMWRFIAPTLAQQYRVILFDYVGAGNSELAAYNPERYSSLEGYATDILEICESLNLRKVTLIGHSVSGIIALIASLRDPKRFDRLIMVCPSPCFLNKPPDYFGGFEREDLMELLNLMDKNYIGWAHYMAPLVMGTSNSESLVGELSGSFCSTDPLIARTFAEATFFSDYRHLLTESQHPALLLQSKTDSLADVSVGQYMHHHMPGSTLKILPAEGHCLHMTHPAMVIDAIQQYMDA